MAIRALIADDESLARERIRTLLQDEPGIQIVGEARDGPDAIAQVGALRPDLLFLDVEMPDVDGFGVLQAIGAENMPLVIFTTAYDQYAIRAFEAAAVDYLLKPFNQERFHTAVERVRRQLDQGRQQDLSERLRALLEQVQARPRALDRLIVKSAGRVVFLKADEIDYVEAAANYVCLHVGKESHLLRETMNSFELKLDSEKFLRIHRSIIVNLEKIRALEPCNNGEYIVVLDNGKELSLSRSYRDRLQKFLDRTSPAGNPGHENSAERRLP
jgi:two-component system LytT family response regulator